MAGSTDSRRLRSTRIVLALAASISLIAWPASASDTMVTGPSSSQTPYIVPLAAGVRAVSILTAGDTVGGYRMVGVPDGLGAVDNGDGTFTLLMNHELGFDQGVARRHGAIGAFVSRWTIASNPEAPAVTGGQDLIKQVALWDTGSDSYVTAQNEILIRTCSADLPAKSAFWNAATHKGWNGTRIYMNGEETSPLFPPSVYGRAFAHLLNGKSYELPRLGQSSFENQLANPGSGDLTIVAGTDDTSPLGQVYVYVGSKTGSGSPIDRAGLTNGSLYGVKVPDMVDEPTTDDPLGADDSASFTLDGFGNVEGWGGALLQTNSETAAVTEFRRPEDGAWDPNHPNDLYFVTTSAFTTPSRLWRLHFNDLANPAAGGTIDLLLEGAEGGHRMFDNMTIDRHRHILIQEDPGSNAYIARIWQYDITTDTLTEIAQHDPARFVAGGASFLTIDEESSGIIDASSILGDGWFLLDVQAHYPIAGEVVEGGQLLALYNPDSDPSAP
jgi:hypothetical protein